MTDDLAPAVLDRVLALTVLLGNDMSADLAARGLSESRAHVLHLIGTDGPVSQRTLAEALGIAPRSVTGLVDGLVASGHVTREPHPTDGRAVLVTPTALGAREAEDLVNGRLELAEQLFQDWWPQHLESFARSLDELLATLTTLIEEKA